MNVRSAVLVAWALVAMVPRFSAARAADAAAEQAAQQARAVQMQRQIEAHARSWEQLLQAPLRAELEIVRRSCGSLSPEARRAIVAAGNQAVKAAARQVAARQMGQAGEKPVDARASIREVVTAAIEQHAAADEFAAYKGECAARLERRAGAARTLIVEKLDRVLELTAAQREAIAADLAKKWQASWIKELDIHGSNPINGYPCAPDFAAACITPHLDARQKSTWQNWTSQAGSGQVQVYAHHIYGHWTAGHALKPDPWWTP